MRSTIEVTFKDGHSETFEDWSYYDYDGKALLLYKGNSCVGIYNIDNIISIVVR